MDMQTYQQLAMRTQVPHRTVASRFDNAVLGLSGEVGELADLWKKHRYHGHDFNPTQALEELGDILWYIAQASDALGVPLEDIAAGNIHKLQLRYPEGFSPERSQNRVK